MIIMLVCSVALMGNGEWAPIETEVCSTVGTTRTVETFCAFTAGMQHAKDRRLSFCSPARGRTRPDPL